MIFKRENFIDENPEDEKFPLKQIEQLTALDGGSPRFIGRVSIGLQTPMGAQSMPVSFEIDADTVEAAFGKFADQAEKEVERAKEELETQMKEMRRQSQNRIVTPDEIASGGMSKLQL